jgi:hypothetical protein
MFQLFINSSNSMFVLIRQTLSSSFVGPNIFLKIFLSNSESLCIMLSLTFRNRASYIYDRHTATLQTPHFIYFFNKYMYWIFWTCCTISVFSFQNAVYIIMLLFVVSVLFAFYIQGVLKFKCQIAVPKG